MFLIILNHFAGYGGFDLFRQKVLEEPLMKWLSPLIGKAEQSIKKTAERIDRKYFRHQNEETES